jgi:hypothetical protein
MAAKSESGIVAVRELLLMNVVARSAPPHRTMDNVENPEPLTVMVEPELPTGLFPGLIAVMTGVGSEERPVPVRFTVFGLFEPSLVIVRDPMRLPDAVGKNFTLTVQLLLAASVAPHVVV